MTIIWKVKLKSIDRNSNTSIDTCTAISPTRSGRRGSARARCSGVEKVVHVRRRGPGFAVDKFYQRPHCQAIFNTYKSLSFRKKRLTINCIRTCSLELRCRSSAVWSSNRLDNSSQAAQIYILLLYIIEHCGPTENAGGENDGPYHL